MQKKPLIGISTCLLGENVRYDGGHKLNRYLKETLGTCVEYVPVCPEVACGLSIPREAMRLVDVQGTIRLMTQKSGLDLTVQMEQWMQPKLDELATMPLCGFIFKAKSPSSGLFRVKVYRLEETPTAPTSADDTPNGSLPGRVVSISHTGRGIFARGVTNRFPLLPVEDDERLNDDDLRENFIERIFAMQRWRDLTGHHADIAELMAFHASHKYLLMAHSPSLLRQAGSLLANGTDRLQPKLFDDYFTIFMNALGKRATVKTNTNVLLHIMGYFKNVLDGDAKAELSETIGNYHRGLIPLIVPITLLNHYVRRFKPRYLESQHYLNAHPLELKLRNHV